MNYEIDPYTTKTAYMSLTTMN